MSGADYRWQITSSRLSLPLKFLTRAPSAESSLEPSRGGGIAFYQIFPSFTTVLCFYPCHVGVPYNNGSIELNKYTVQNNSRMTRSD